MERIFSSLGYRVQGTLGNHVYRVQSITANGDDSTFAAKLWVRNYADEHIDPKCPLGSRLGQLENEIQILTGPLKDCPGVPKVVVHRAHNYLALLQQPVGESLDKLQISDDPMKIQLLDDVEREVTTILTAVHTKGVMHSDVKPSNIIRTQDNDFVLIDFGMSILTKDRCSGTHKKWIGGTPAYGSLRYDAHLPLTPTCDFVSLRLTLRALDMGISNWLEHVNNGKKWEVERRRAINLAQWVFVLGAGIAGVLYLRKK